MNIVYIALLLCVICHVFASEAGLSMSQVTRRVGAIKNSPEARKFRNAIKKGEVKTARVIFTNGNDGQNRYCSEYLAGLGSERFAKLIECSGNYKWWPLKIIMLHAKQGLINEVFDN